MRSSIQLTLALLVFLHASAAQAEPQTAALTPAVDLYPPAVTPSQPPVVAAPVVAAPVVAAPAPVDASVGKDGNPLAGYHGGYFFLRDTDDNYRLYLQGRAHIDFYSYAGPGVSDTTLKPTLFLRRARPEFSGEFFHRWWFMIAGDFGATAIDNPRGTNETSAAPPGTQPTAATARYNAAETTKVSAAATDVFLNFRAAPWLNFQAGQFDAPFTMENRTSEKWGTPFMERSLTVRDVAVPTQKQIGLMAWGEACQIFNYAVGLFDGDGQNRPNVDSNADVFARAYVMPLASRSDALKNLEVGASVRYGGRDHEYTDYDVPALTTQGQYTFWNPVYTSSAGQTHIIYSGHQRGVAFEARVPVSLVDFTTEVTYIDKGTREAVEGFEATSSDRFGSLRGYSYYLEFGFWPLGNRDINGLPGVQNMPHVDFAKPDPALPPRALQLLAKWEQVRLNYSSARRSGSPDPQNIDGDIKVNAFSLGANYWLTKHLRFTVNYVLNLFPDSAPVKASPAGSATQTATQRALAPANMLSPGVNDDARSNGHVLHEFLARTAVAF
ncbi:MAG TPA: porin [Polyangiaceae bacterium]|jgi:phosphate-selective porin|nr:porin [Polyangiaceae bacterium]